MRTEFFVPMKPPTKTHQQKRIRVSKGNPVVYEDAELQSVRTKLQDYVGQHTPTKPFSGALRLVVKWCFPIAGNHHNGEYKTSKPDTDNLNKLLKDVMTTLGFWQDDALVASEIIEKFWADIPGIYISVEELEP